MSINFIGLDFETTGTDPWGLAVPIQIGIAFADVEIDYLIGGWNWTEHEWNPVSEEIHKFTREQVDAALPVWKVDILCAAKLIPVVGSRMWNIPVGWNVGGFDRQFVTRWMPNLNRLLSYRCADLNSMVFAMTGGAEAEYERIKKAAKEMAASAMEHEYKDGEKWHDALYDAKAAIHSYWYLVNQFAFAAKNWCIEHMAEFYPAPIGECGYWKDHKEGNKCIPVKISDRDLAEWLER